MTRYRIQSRFFVLSFLFHLGLAAIALLIVVPILKPPPEEIKIEFLGAQLLDPETAEAKLDVMIKSLEALDAQLKELEEAEKKLKEALGAYGTALVEQYAKDEEIGGDVDPGFDTGESFQVAQELVELGKEAVEPLLDALDNLEDDFKTRRRAAKTLAMIKDNRALPTLIDRFLADTDPASWGIMLGMNNMADSDPKRGKMVGTEMLRAAKDPEQMAKMAGRWLFVSKKSFGGQDAYEKQLQRFLMDGDTKTRNAFFNMAPHYGPLNKRSQRVLAKLMLEIPDEKIRARAAQAIGVSGGGIEVIDELKRAMKNDTSVDVRAAALTALNASRAKDKIAINIEATKDVAATIRRRATEALKWGSIPPEKRKAAILALRGLVEDEDIAVRQYALVGLGRHRALEAFPDIMRALDDKEGKIQMSAMSAISHFTSSMELDKDSIDMVLEFASKDKMNAKGRAVGKGHWLHGGGVVTRWTAMSIATRYAPRDKAINMLISQLKQPELRTRGRALGHLVQLRAAEAAPHIGKLLAHPSLGLRGHAAWALGRLGQRQYIPAIIALMNDEDILSGKGIQPNSWARGTKPQPMPYGGYSGPEPGSPRPAIIKSLGDLGAIKAIPDLITLMETHSHPMTRLAAAGVLRRWARLDKRIVPALGRITEDVHPKSQLLVIRWLVEIGDKRAIPYLEKLLTGEYKKPTETSPFAVEAMEDKTVWAETVLALAKFRHRKIIPMLKKQLPNADETKQRAIINALGTLGADDTIPEMLNIMDTHPSPGVRMGAAAAALRWADSDKRIIPALVRLAEGTEGDARLQIVRWLIATGDARATAYFQKLTAGELPPKPSQSARFAAFRALVQSGDAGVIPLLKKQLASTDEAQQAQAAEDLLRIAGDEGKSIAIKTYRKHLDSKTAGIQARAALALGGLGDSSQLPRIIALAKSLPPDSDRLRVLKGLTKLGHRDGVPELLGEIIANRKPKDWSAPIRAVDFAPHINAVECIPAISDVIMNERGRWHMRYRAAAALCAMGHRDGIPALLHDKVLYGRPAYGRFWILRALRKFDDKRVVRALAKFIEKPFESPASRGIAAETLGAIGDAEAIPPLIRQLKNTDLIGSAAVLRMKAAAALAAMRAEAALGTLAEIARDDADPAVKKAAVEAIENIKSPPAEVAPEEAATGAG